MNRVKLIIERVSIKLDKARSRWEEFIPRTRSSRILDKLNWASVRIDHLYYTGDPYPFRKENNNYWP